MTPPLIIIRGVNSLLASSTSPALKARAISLKDEGDLIQYLISASLICSGLCTFLQVATIKIPGTKWQIGTGLLSVMGTANQAR